MSTLKTNNIQHVDRSDPSIIINTDGSVNIAGTMTYEDVTNVDAVGIITGRSNIDAQKQVLVGTGVSVKAGGLNVTAGITTVQALQATTGAFTGNLTITNTAPQISLVDSDNNSDFSIYGSAGVFNIYDETNSASRLQVASNGTVTVVQGLELSSTLTIPDSIIHSGDTNTKIRFPAADTVTVETAGVERLRVEADGNVNIGAGSGNQSTLAPVLQLHKASSSATSYLHITNTDSGVTNNDGFVIGFNGSNDALLFNKESTPLRFATSGSEAMRIDASGRVLIQTTDRGADNADDLTISGGGHSGITIRSGTTHQSAIYMSDATTGSGEYAGYVLYDHNVDALRFGANTADRMRIDSAGRLLINKTTNRDKYFNGTYTGQLQVEGTNDATRLTQFIHNSGNASQPILILGKSRGGVGDYTAVQNSDFLGTLSFQGADGDEMVDGARIDVIVTGTPDNDDMPAEMRFRTNSGSASPTIRMTIDSTGNTHFGSSGTLNSSNTVSIVPSDGLINFGMDGRSSFVTGQNSAYIYSGDGSSGTTLAGDLILQSRSNQNRTIRFVVGDGNPSPTPVQKARIDQYGMYVNGTVSGKAASLTSAKAGNFDPFVFDVNGSAQSTETVAIKAQKNDCLDLTRYYTAGTIQTFRFNNDFTGQIETGTTSVTYHTSSDYRLKENAVSISDGITRLKQLKPYKFNFIKEPSVIHDGFFAHEVTPVVPTAVSGEKDATETTYYETGDILPEGKEIGDIKEENAVKPQSLDHSKLVPLLTAALKEEVAKREALEARVAAIEKIAGI